MAFFNKKEEKIEDKLIKKETYHFFTLFIGECQLTFLSKQKNQIEQRLQNLRDTYQKGIPMTFQVKELGRDYSLDIEPKDDICQIIIPNLREIKLIKKGETEI